LLCAVEDYDRDLTAGSCLPTQKELTISPTTPSATRQAVITEPLPLMVTQAPPPSKTMPPLVDITEPIALVIQQAPPPTKTTPSAARQVVISEQLSLVVTQAPPPPTKTMPPLVDITKTAPSLVDKHASSSSSVSEFVSPPSVVVSYSYFCSSKPVLYHRKCNTGAASLLGKRKNGDDTCLISTNVLQFHALSDNMDTGTGSAKGTYRNIRSSQAPKLTCSVQEGPLECADSHGEKSSFREQDSGTYFTKTFLDKHPTAVRNCAICAIQFGEIYKVSSKLPVYACGQAHKTHDPCTYAICSPCYSVAFANLSTADRSAGRISSRRSNAGTNPHRQN
jgi:hypothetical protein